ncbi:type II secretion system protein GspF, partial [bacterium]|nr:type II secretion system protein GspF [bacterium]
VSVMIIVFLMTEVVPKILAIFDDNQQSLPVITKILIVLSRGISLLIPYILIAALILIVYFLRKKTDLKFKRAWHKALIENSLYKRFIQLTQIPRYLHTMHILLSSGVNVLDSMNVSTQLLTNLIVQDAFNRATQQVKEGIAISRSLAQTHWFSNMTIHLIQSGEKSGQLAVMLERSAMQIDTTRQQFLDTALKLLEPLIILLMGGFVLFIVLAILLPIFQMQQLV